MLRGGGFGISVGPVGFYRPRRRPSIDKFYTLVLCNAYLKVTLGVQPTDLGHISLSRIGVLSYFAKIPFRRLSALVV